MQKKNEKNSKQHQEIMTLLKKLEEKIDKKEEANFEILK